MRIERQASTIRGLIGPSLFRTVGNNPPMFFERETVAADDERQKKAYAPPSLNESSEARTVDEL